MYIKKPLTSCYKENSLRSKINISTYILTIYEIVTSSCYLTFVGYYQIRGELKKKPL